jgi:uncharacterized cupin superfamily protein
LFERCEADTGQAHDFVAVIKGEYTVETFERKDDGGACIVGMWDGTPGQTRVATLGEGDTVGVNNGLDAIHDVL